MTAFSAWEPDSLSNWKDQLANYREHITHKIDILNLFKISSLIAQILA